MNKITRKATSVKEARTFAYAMRTLGFQVNYYTYGNQTSVIGQRKGAKLMPKSQYWTQARNLMITVLNNNENFRDCGEIQCTELAEYVACELQHSEWLDDSDHWIWDLTVQVSELYS